MSTELAIRPEQTGFDDKQIAALRALGVQNASNADIAVFFHQAARTGLDPFARQIYLISRGGKQTIQVGIDGFRLIRDRAGTYRGHTEDWCGPDGHWRDVWLSEEPPSAARVQVYVDGYVHPVVGIALWTEYAQIGRDGKPQALWNPRGGKPALMLAKCAEALALRKAYPQDLSGLYTTDEIPVAERGPDGVPSVTRVQPPQDAEVVNETTGEITEERPAWGDRWEPAPWEDAIANALSAEPGDRLAQLRRVYREASQAGVLRQAMANGTTLADTITGLAKRAEQDHGAEKPEDGAA